MIKKTEKIEEGLSILSQECREYITSLEKEVDTYYSNPKKDALRIYKKKLNDLLRAFEETDLGFKSDDKSLERSTMFIKDLAPNLQSGIDKYQLELAEKHNDKKESPKSVEQAMRSIKK
jgi:hypothetical protein